MGYLPLEKLLPKAGGSIYKLVRLASVRATELAEGKPRLVEKIDAEKVVSIALEEIANSKVVSAEVADKFMPRSKVKSKESPKEPEAELAGQEK